MAAGFASTGMDRYVPAQRGTQRFQTNVGYAGNMGPEVWADDNEYNKYLDSQNAPKAGPSTGSYKNAAGTASTSYSQNPNMATTQYKTTPQSGTQTSGLGTISQPAYYNQQQTQLEGLLASQMQGTQNKQESDILSQKAALGDKSFQSRLSAISGLQSGGGSQPRVEMGPGGGMSNQETGARNAAFARAKDQSGLIGNAALRNLQDIMGARGIQGSTIEQEGIGNVLSNAAGGMGQFNQEQLLQDLARSGEIANTTYQGNITQRGQDLQRQQSLLALINSGGSLY